MISSPRAELNRYFRSLSLELSAKKCIAHKHCFFNKKKQFIAHKHCFSAKKHSKEQFEGNQSHAILSMQRIYRDVNICKGLHSVVFYIQVRENRNKLNFDPKPKDYFKNIT